MTDSLAHSKENCSFIIYNLGKETDLVEGRPLPDKLSNSGEGQNQGAQKADSVFQLPL